MPNPPTDPRDGFTPGPWRAEFNTYRENGSLTITDSYIHSPEGARMFLDCDPEQASRIVDGMNERNALLADNERQAKVIEAMREALETVERAGAWCGSDDNLIRNADGVVVCCDIDDCTRQETLVKVRAALALAGGGE